MGILFCLQQFGEDGRARLILDALRYGHHAASQAVIDLLHVRQELFHFEGALRQVNEMRAVIGILLRDAGRCRQEARVPAHHHADVDAGQGTVIQVQTDEGLRHVLGCRGVAGRVVVEDQVIVNGLGDVDCAELIV